MAEEPAAATEVTEEGGEEPQASEPTFGLDAVEEFYRENFETSEAVEFIAKKLEFAEYTTNVKEAIQAELYEHMLSYSKTCGFSAEQTASFIGMFAIIVTSLKSGKTQEETETLAKEGLTGMCETVPNFNATIVKFMLDFLAQTVFQHYSLYSYVYQLPQREQDLVNVTLEVETPRVPPLSKGELQVDVEPEVGEAEGEEEAETNEAADPQEEEDQEAEDPEEQEPNPVNDAIESEIARRVDLFKEKLQKEYAEREEALLAKIKQIEAK